MLSRRTFLKVLSSAGISLSATQYIPLSYASTKPYKWTSIRNDIGVYTGGGGTVGCLLSDESIVVVDTASSLDSAYQLLAEIRNQSSNMIDLVINTHHHGLHSAGNIVFKDHTKMLLAHENSKINQKLEYERASLKKRWFDLPTQYYPNITIKNEWSKQFSNETVNVKYFGPAHTDGDVVVHFQNTNVAHLGDLCYRQQPAFFDNKSGATFLNSIKVLEEIQKHYDKDTKFICGHSRPKLSPVCDIKEVKAFEDFLRRVLDTVNTAIKAGHSNEKIINLDYIPGAEEWTGKMLKSTLAAAYHDLANSRV
jgi:cyclase